jgi:hypothetical protein
MTIIFADTFNMKYEDLETWLEFKKMDYPNWAFVFEFPIKTSHKGSNYIRIVGKVISVISNTGGGNPIQKFYTGDPSLKYEWETIFIGGIHVLEWTNGTISIAIDDTERYEDQDQDQSHLQRDSKRFHLQNLSNDIKSSFETITPNRVWIFNEDQVTMPDVSDYIPHTSKSSLYELIKNELKDETPRTQRMTFLASQGLQDGEIASALNMSSVGAVSTQLTRVREKHPTIANLITRKAKPRENLPNSKKK